MAVVIAQCRAGTLPKNVGQAHRGLHGEPELLREWAKRNRVPLREARRLHYEHKLPYGVVVGRTGPKLEWFETFPGIKGVLLTQAHHGHAIIQQYKLVQSYQRRIWKWQASYSKFARALEHHRLKLRRLYAEHWKLRGEIAKAKAALQRGDTYFASHDLDEIKNRLFGPDIVELEAAQRRKKWRKRGVGKKSVVPGVREKSQTGPRASGLPGDAVHWHGDRGSAPGGSGHL
jgi:hypothetical protein